MCYFHDSKSACTSHSDGHVFVQSYEIIYNSFLIHSDILMRKLSM